MLRLDADTSQRYRGSPSSSETPYRSCSAVLHSAYPWRRPTSPTISRRSATRSSLSLFGLAEGAYPRSGVAPHPSIAAFSSRGRGSYSMEPVDALDPFAPWLAMPAARRLWFLSLVASLCMPIPTPHIGDFLFASQRGPPRHAFPQM